MAQNVGPILNMVTSKYLLRSHEEWQARQVAQVVFDRVVAAVDQADFHALGRSTTENWNGPLKKIIPWVSNAFTEAIISEARRSFGDDLWGFLMLGGMSGGGMAFFVAPHRHDEFQESILAIMRREKSDLDDALPFAMEPVVYDFQINPRGTWAELVTGESAMMPSRYYTPGSPDDRRWDQ
jgi:galactokinase/mevalonate kinase-like predicted kinase